MQKTLFVHMKQIQTEIQLEWHEGSGFDFLERERRCYI